MALSRWAYGNIGYEAVLVEPGLTGAQNARRRGLADVICSTLEDAEFPAHSLPAIGIFDVLEHIEDDQRFLCELQGLLRPGGRLYVTVPTYRWLWSSDDVFSGHFRRYTRASLVREMNHAGFEVEFSSYLFAMLLLPIFCYGRSPAAWDHATSRRPTVAREHCCGWIAQACGRNV